MLYLDYIAGMEEVKDKPVSLSEPRKELIRLLNSNTYFNELMETLPEGWESKCGIQTYFDPLLVSRYFKNYKKIESGRQTVDKEVIAVIHGKSYHAKPGKYFDYIKRDKEFGFITDDELSEFSHAEFHVDHKLVWVIEDKMCKNEIIYTINVYIPPTEVISNVELIKRSAQ